MTITTEVSRLVKSILRTFSRPYGEDVIEDIFVAIENNPGWLNRYKQIAFRYDRGAINPTIGKQTKDQTGMKVLRTVKAKRTTLISSYTKLKP